jgi:hypothetical protein
MVVVGQAFSNEIAGCRVHPAQIEFQTQKRQFTARPEPGNGQHSFLVEPDVRKLECVY